MIGYENALLIKGKVDEQLSISSGTNIKCMDCKIYFIDDEVILTTTDNAKPVIGRIKSISSDMVTLDISEHFKSRIVEIERRNIINIEMHGCPENVLIRKHMG